MSLFNKKSQRQQKVPPLFIPRNLNINELMAEYIHILENEKHDEAAVAAALLGLKHIRETIFESHRHHNPSVMSSSSDEWELETPEPTLFGSVSEMIPIYEGYELEKPLPPIVDTEQQQKENLMSDHFQQSSLKDRTVLF